jgi:hypothetical protein
MESEMKVKHQADFCVVGGGMAGLCAAVTAARKGSKVVLMHDRPVFGGNASSECRVHICGADRHNNVKNMRETGFLEEVRMENLYRNPNRNFSVWDSLLYDKIISEPNITSLLNCTCQSAEMNGSSIQSVTGWQLTSQTYHIVEANIFADCSGDAVLAPVTGADYRIGREARDEYQESIAPEKADNRTMGMTCLFQAREYNSLQTFEPPHWARKFETCDELPGGVGRHSWFEMGYWWVELGGEQDSIHDTEELRDELLKITFGIWDHIKNRCPDRRDSENWALDWIQFLPGKRESRRYTGAYVLNQNDIESSGLFDDIVAYGGWAMDDHHPAGFEAVKIAKPPTIFHPTPSPYGIPYRSLYSRNITNLMFAGRDASCTHAAMSSSRVMGTGSSMGQAVGMAAAIAAEKDLLPAEIRNHIVELQQELMLVDAYMPGVKQTFIPLVTSASLTASQGDPEPVRDGISRPVGDDDHCWICRKDGWIEYRFQSLSKVSNITVILDSGLDLQVALSYHQKDDQLTAPPHVMPKGFRIDGLVDDKWVELFRTDRNYQRFCRLAVNRALEGLRFTLDETWGAEESRLYSFYMD